MASLHLKLSPPAWYYLTVGVFVVPMGIQTVLFPWLITIELALGATELGFGQMALQLPALFLVLVGGFLADRFDAKRMLMSLYLLAAVPPVLLALLIFNGHLSYWWMLVFAVITGTINSFAQPARDKLLSSVAGTEVQKTVTIVMGLTFGAQILGYGAARFADTLGAVTLLGIMAVLLCLGFVAAGQLPETTTPGQLKAGMGEAIADGLRIVKQSESMCASAILLASISLFYGGTFMVLNPLIVRDVYQGGAAEISLSFAMFMSGTILATVMLVVRGGMQNTGRALIVAVVVGGGMLTIASFGLAWAGYLATIFAWGCCGGVAMSMGRTIMQELAPETHRARVMSVFSLANVGCLPFGAALLGFSADIIGILPSFLLAAAGGWCSVLYILVKTNLVNIQHQHPDS